MGNWGEYWRTVCAPKLKRRKEELGRAVPERDIASAVEAATGKRSTRALVSLWLLGEREPYISQFYALCEKLGADPLEVLAPVKAEIHKHSPLRRINLSQRPQRIPEKKNRRA